MRSIKKLLFVLALFLVAADVSFAQNLIAAPLNPEFVKYRDGVTKAQNAESERNFGIVPSPVDMSHVKFINSGVQAVRANALPVKFDLRDKGWMPPVRDQGNYGTCWAFGTLGSVESSLLAQGNGKHDFSRSHLAYFARVDTPDMSAFTQYSPPANDDPIYDQGGNSFMATAILARGTGIVNESDRPYPLGTPWVESERPLITDPISMRLSGFNYLSEKIESVSDRDALKNYIMQNGAVSISYYAGDDYSCYSSDTYAYFSNISSTVNHVVLLIGWDDNFSKNNFNQNNIPESDGAWLMKNNWGENWGNKGYFWVSYEENIVDISQMQAEDKGKYEHTYQYDPLGWVADVGFKTNNPHPETASYANIFTANGNELINSVSTYFTAPIVEYEISVYRHVEEGKPTGGRLAQKLSFSGSSTDYKYAGYHKFELPKPVYVGKGEKFSVVVTLTTIGYEYPIPIEFQIEGYSDKATSNAGESFAVDEENIWNDMNLYPEYINTNVCIKAFSTGATGPDPDKPRGSSGCNAGTVFIALFALPFLLRKKDR